MKKVYSLIVVLALVLVLGSTHAIAGGANASAGSFSYRDSIVSFRNVKNIPQNVGTLSVEPGKNRYACYGEDHGMTMEYTYDREEGLSFWQCWALSRFHGDRLKVIFMADVSFENVAKVVKFKGSALDVSFEGKPTVEMIQELAKFRGAKLRVAFLDYLYFGPTVPDDVFGQLKNFGGQELAIACGTSQSLESILDFEGSILRLEAYEVTPRMMKQVNELLIDKVVCVVRNPDAIREIFPYGPTMEIGLPCINSHFAAALADCKADLILKTGMINEGTIIDLSKVENLISLELMRPDSDNFSLGGDLNMASSIWTK